MPFNTFKLVHALILTFVFTVIMGCSKQQQIEKDLLAYQERLSSFTGIEIAHNNKLNIQLNAPLKSSLAQNIEQIYINLRELYALQECTLNQVVAERNTALGKMQLPSNRYSYEIALLDELANCRTQILSKENQENASLLINQLENWEEQKKVQLPLAWSNFMTQSDELYLHMSSSPSYISGDEEDNFITSKQAWTSLSMHTDYFLETQAFESKVKQGNLPIPDNLEQHLQHLEQSRLLARMWKTQLLITNILANTTPLLDEYLNLNTCSNAKQAADITIMRNIFTMFFAEKIQSLAAELNKYHYQLAPLVLPLSEADVLPNAYKDFLKRQLVTNHEMYKTTMKIHIEKWQQVFARCD